MCHGFVNFCLKNVFGIVCSLVVYQKFFEVGGPLPLLVEIILQIRREKIFICLQKMNYSPSLLVTSSNGRPASIFFSSRSFVLII